MSDYSALFRRNLGLVSESEQEKLQSSRVAVAGLGGVGGIHLVTLARMGIGRFNLADLDTFGEVNMNRQYGANARTIGRPKVEVMAEVVRDINPDVDLRLYTNGVQPDNVEEFLGDADAVVDSIDYFAIKARILLYKTARRMGKTVFFSAPIGHSGTLHVFTPESMSFFDYYDIREDMAPFDQLVAFSIGLTPKGTHWKYMDLSRVDLNSHAGPSLASACDISAGLLTTEVFTHLLSRRPLRAAPQFMQFDPYRGLFRQGRLPFGNKGPLQRLKRWIVARKFQDQAAEFNRQMTGKP
ncbi:MAG: ThiF family adenylyltransferase [Pseudomonadota bacterium]